MWTLRTPENAISSFTFRIPPGKIKTIGRAAGADFIVDATLVSRLHCRLSAGAVDLHVEDLESTNGTYVNGERVARAALRSGDTLAVGEIQFLVSRADRPDRTAQRLEDL